MDNMLCLIGGVVLGIAIGYSFSKGNKDSKSLQLILKKLTEMGDNLNQIKADLQAANTKADKIAADVKLLHDKIDNVDGETPTVEEWQEVKDMSTSLNNKLQGIDDTTPEETEEPI